MPPSAALPASKPPKAPNALPSTSVLNPLVDGASPSYGSLTTENKASPPRTIAASTSFFGIQPSFSSGSLRDSLGFPLPERDELDWLSIAVVYWITLVSEASRGLMLPSTWPYFQSLGGTKLALGVFVASFSMGRMATTIPLGYLSDKFSTGTVLAIASVIQVLGHLAYALAPSLPVLYASRIIVGFGSATMSVCRAHITRAVPSSLRTHHFAYLSALQFIGFAVLPGLGGLLAMLPEYHPLPFVKLNGFTYPAHLLVFCNWISVALIYSLYFNPPIASPARHSSPSHRASSQIGPDVLALVVCLLVNVAFRGVIAEFETVSTPFLMEQFGMSYGGASFAISVIGFFGLGVYLFFKPIARTFSDRALVAFGLVVVLLGCFPLAFDAIADHIPVNVYVACLGLTWSLAYPVGQTAILALFSKVLSGLPAGGFLGIFSATGSIARVVFAMLAGLTWSHLGRESVFGTILAYMSLATVLVLTTYRRLVPPPDIV